MPSIADLIASLRPKPRSYTFEGLPGRPTFVLRDVDADHPAVALMQLKKELADGAEKVKPSTVEEVERARAAEAMEWIPLLVERMTTDDGAEYSPADVLEFCVAIAVQNYVSRWVPFVTYAVSKPEEASPDAIAGE